MHAGKKALFGVALLLCASLAFAESARVKADNVNVRSAPTTTARVVAKLPQGKMLTVVEVSGQWTQVTDGAITGWISSALLERVGEARAASPATSGSSGRNRSSEPTSRDAAPFAQRPIQRADSDERPFNLGIGASWQDHGIGFGAEGRVLFTPVSSLPGLRIVGVVDAYFTGGTPIYVTGNAIYVFRTVSQDVHPYVGGGIVYWHTSNDAGSASGMDVDVAGGAVIKRHFFGEVRLVFYSGSTGVAISAGLKL